MSPSVSLRRVAEEMDLPSPDWTLYIHRTTGELVLVTDDDLRASESDDDKELPDWQAENLPKVREVLSSDDFLALPGKDEFDEYGLMKSFANALADAAASAELLRAIQGKGAFRRLKDVVEKQGKLDAWYAYRDGALEELVAERLTANSIEFTRE